MTFNGFSVLIVDIMVNIYPTDVGVRGGVSGSGPGQASGTGSFKNSVPRPQPGSLKRSKSVLENILGPAFASKSLDIPPAKNEEPVFTIEE